MMRSLFAAASGLRNHQIRMDVIGDNIANVNTLGFKSSSVQFSTLLAQNMAGATAPTATRGGTNPMQVGLGSAVGAVTSNFEQGSLQSTGITTDLSVQGDALFVLGRDDRRLFTRAGSFRFDGNGMLTDPVSGLSVMGYLADTNGDIQTTGEVSQIVVPTSQPEPANPTTTIELGGNLNADSSALGTILETGELLDSVTSAPAAADALLVNLTNSDGVSLGLASTDVITVSGVVGGVAVTPATYNVTLTSRVSDLTAAIEGAFGLAAGSVSIGTDGTLTITGDDGLTNEITNVSINATDAGATTTRTEFDAVMGATYLQHARDAEVYAISRTIYDSLGANHLLTITLERQAGEGEWAWSASVDGEASILSGGSGTVSFAPDGTLESWGFDGGASSLLISPGDGADNINLSIDPGEIGSLEGLIQFSSSSSAVVRSQNGYGVGLLESLSIDQNGVISGIFTNGVSRALAQIALARFTNPSGLERSESNNYVASANSGEAQIGTIGSRISGRLLPGTLEMSNVDLALEFTNMVIAQRGFQANARIISTSEDMLTELVNLKR